MANRPPNYDPSSQHWMPCRRLPAVNMILGGRMVCTPNSGCYFNVRRSAFINAMEPHMRG